MFKVAAGAVVACMVLLTPQANDVTSTLNQTPYSDPELETFWTQDPGDGASGWTFDSEIGLGGRYYHEYDFNLVDSRIVTEPTNDEYLGFVYKIKILSHPPASHSHQANLRGEILNFWAMATIKPFPWFIGDSNFSTSATGRLRIIVDNVETDVYNETVEAEANAFGGWDDTEPEYVYDQDWGFEINAGMEVRFYDIHVHWEIDDDAVMGARLQLKCIGDIFVTLRQ